MDCYVILQNYCSLHLNQTSNDAHYLDPSNFVLDEKRGRQRSIKSGNQKLNLNYRNSNNNTGSSTNNLSAAAVKESKHFESEIAID